MKVKWNGHASFTLTSADGTVLVTDPYDPSGYGGVIKYEPVTDQADGVLVSHDHADHNYVESLSGSPEVLKGSGRVKGVDVQGIASFHDESQGSERGTNTIFAFSMDGVRVCFVGDLGHRVSQDQVREIGPVDLLLLPVGGTFTLNARAAADVAEALRPRVVIPMHFKTDKCDLPIEGVEAFLSEVSGVKKIGASEVDVSGDKLPGNREVWVLDFAC